jgi:hypothetical protein
MPVVPWSVEGGKPWFDNSGGIGAAGVAPTPVDVPVVIGLAAMTAVVASRTAPVAKPMRMVFI